MSQISKAISIKITCKEIDSVVDSFPLTLNEDLYNFHVLTFVYQMFFCLSVGNPPPPSPQKKKNNANVMANDKAKQIKLNFYLLYMQ